MTIKDTNWLQLYKKECKAYFKYDSALTHNKLELEETEQKIKNVRSPITNRVGGHQIVSTEEKLVSLIEIKTEIEYQIAYYESIMKWIRDVNDAITSPAYRAITWQTLIQAKNKTDLMINYDVDPEYVYYMRDRFLSVALDDEKKQEYNEVQKKKAKSKWLSANNDE